MQDRSSKNKADHDRLRGNQIKGALCINHGPGTEMTFQILYLIFDF